MNLLEEIQQLYKRIHVEIEQIQSAEDLEQFRLVHLVKKGTVQELVDKMREVPKEQKPLVGKELNVLKSFAESAFAEKKELFTASSGTTATIDITLPGKKPSKGSLHPVMKTMDHCIEIFKEMGFTVAQGPEVESDYFNFEALNFPADHPARDMQDTFFIKDKMGTLLRTHTTPVQIRIMQEQKPPIRSIMPGRVYRNEALDATHLAEFHQIDGIYIDKGVTFADLKGTMFAFAQRMFGATEVRFRTSFFPFTEPSAEIDMKRIKKNGEVSWMEICGCGMVHPNVLRNCGLDPEVYSGFAFGFGVERITMLTSELPDIRALYENDVRVLEQF